MPPINNLLSLIRKNVPYPATSEEIFQLLRISNKQRSDFTRQFKVLISKGKLVQGRGDRFSLPEMKNFTVGRLVTNPAGFGFVIPDDIHNSTKTQKRSRDQDIHISSGNLMNAMHGDRVVVRIKRRTKAGVDGQIVQILERGNPRVVGSFQRTDLGVAYVVPFDRRLLMNIKLVVKSKFDVKPGHIVVIEITRWPSEAHQPVGRIIKVLGSLDEPGVDTSVVIHMCGIPETHSQDALNEGRRLGATVKKSDLEGRTDFRSLVTVTIDGEDARDFDDAITIEKLKDGHYRLGVHIADVAHYVKEGGALDIDAYQRGTSVYFSERAVHMFPSELSTELCSLKPNVNRLVQSCFMDLNSSGQVVRYELHDSVIRSNARMTYSEVKEILVDRNDVLRSKYKSLVPKFELMQELFELLHKKRKLRGTIDFDLPEAKVVMTQKGEVKEVVAVERNVAHRIIEEFMLLANETVAEHLDRNSIPALYRIHESPDANKVEDFKYFIKTLGHGLGVGRTLVKPKHFQQLIDRVRGTSEERPISSLMLRTMQRARYDALSLGHFGLGTKYYTHFTSPIRRYPDLVVHRMLRESRQGKLLRKRRENLTQTLPKIAQQMSEMERRATEAERQLLQWRKVRFMLDKVGDEFESYVTGVSSAGVFVELIEHYVEGLVPISSMADDYYRLIEGDQKLRGENTKKEYRLGDKVLVQVVQVNLEKKQIDFGIIEILDSIRRKTRPAKVKGRKSKTDKRRSTRPGRRERSEKRRTKRPKSNTVKARSK
tara:strand:+ start:1268 stop:3574 length:2307 start_codon:yes stop_codon:yes gene_type:complete